MANKEKERINVNMYDDKSTQDTFRNGFLVALANDTIWIKGNRIYMEATDKIYITDLKQFSFVWHHSFEHIFRNDFLQFLDIGKINPGMMRSLYEWMNPVLDQLPIKINEKAKFVQKFQEKLKKDEGYYDVVRTATLEQIRVLSLDRRKKYIDRFEPFGIITKTDKINLEYYADYSPVDLKKLFETEDMTDKDKVEIVSQAFVLERQREAQSEKKNKKGYNSRIIQLVNLLPVPEILDVFMSGVLSEEEFVRTKVTKKDLLNSPYDVLLEILSEKNDILPEPLKITSKDLVREYGRSLNGNTIYKLAMYGYINPEDLIEVFEINKALRMVEKEENLLDSEELRAYYTPALLINMKKDGGITPYFVEEFAELYDFENHPESFHYRSQMLVEELRRESQDKPIQEDVLDFFDLGLCDVQTTREYISEDDIERRFVDDKISLEKVFEYYQKGLIGDEAISKYYEKEELLEFYNNGQVSGIVLRAITDVNFLLEAFCDGKIADEDFLRLYLDTENISVSDLDFGLQVAEKEIDISSFINENTPYSKIKELFSNRLIDYATILRLHNQGVLNDAQLEEIKAAVSTREFFEDLKSGKTYKVVTSRQGQVSPRGKVIVGDSKKKDFSQEIALISTILEKDVEQENYSLIESYNSKGRATSLNNYRIFGNEGLDGIVILQKSKPENAVYVTSALQMLYFLKGKENSEGQIEIQNRMKDKAYLKTIEGVEVVEHTEYFARNLVEAASRISPKIAEKIKTEEGKYVADVERIITDMREKYLEDKAKGRDD